LKLGQLHWLPLSFLNGRLLDERFPGAYDARDRLEVAGHFDFVPSGDEVADGIDNRAADFQKKPSAGAKECVCLRD
jgi:hypothetical protein